jgi:hypothetical protein
MRWGLIPGWWKKTAKEVPSTFNARAETIAESRCFVRPSNARAASCYLAITSGTPSTGPSSPISSAHAQIGRAFCSLVNTNQAKTHRLYLGEGYFAMVFKAHT